MPIVGQCAPHQCRVCIALGVCPISFQQQLQGVQLFPSFQFSSSYGYFQLTSGTDSFACAYYFYTAAQGGCSYFW